MRAYVGVTGAIFGLIVVAHMLRIVDEGTRILTEPSWVILTLLAAALCVWAWRVLRKTSRR